MTLVIDCRECKLIKLLENDNVDIKKKQLEIGDIQVLNNSEEIRYLIERKSINDLIASLRDGRYREQKLRVMSSIQNNQQFKNAQFLYLIEGNLENETNDNKKAIYGTYISLLLRDNIKIIKTDNLEETNNFLIRLINRLKTKDDLIKITNSNNQINSNNNDNNNNSNNINNNNQYLESIKSSKKKNINVKNCQILFLNVIPGISVKIANVIIEQYTSINNLINQYHRLENIKEKDELLKDVQITTKRKLGKVLSKKIYQHLCCINETQE